MSSLAKVKTHQQTLFYRELDLVLLLQKVEPGRTHIVISDSTATPPFANIVISVTVSTVTHPSGNIVISVSTATLPFANIVISVGTVPPLSANINRLSGAWGGTRQGCTI